MNLFCFLKAFFIILCVYCQNQSELISNTTLNGTLGIDKNISFYQFNDTELKCIYLC